MASISTWRMTPGLLRYVTRRWNSVLTARRSFIPKPLPQPMRSSPLPPMMSPGRTQSLRHMHKPWPQAVGWPWLKPLLRQRNSASSRPSNKHDLSYTYTERLATMHTPGIVKGIAVRDASRAPMKEQQQVEVSLAHGIVQDYRGTGLRQVTFLDVGQWQEVLDELGI